MAALAEMYVQGVSTRKVKAITEELCGHSFSASAISAINQRLDASLGTDGSNPAFLQQRVERTSSVEATRRALVTVGRCSRDAPFLPAESGHQPTGCSRAA